MKCLNYFNYIVFTCCILYSSSFIAQNYTFANWYNNETACAVITYDDWLTGHGPIAIPQLVDREMAATFFVNTEWAGNGGGYTTMNYAEQNGIEIANHTVNHPNLSDISLVDATTNINLAKEAIKLNVIQEVGQTFAYPFGAYNNDVINAVKENHFAARAVWGTWFWQGDWRYDFHTLETFPSPYYEITTYAVNDEVSPLNIHQEMTNAINNGGLITFMLHAIFNDEVGNPDGFDAINENFHGSFLDQIQGFENDFWITTFRAAMKYHKERHSANLNTITKTQNSWTLQLTDNLPDSIFNHPLTINLDLDFGDEVQSISQNQEQISYSIDGSVLTFNAIPDNGDINIALSELTSTIQLEPLISKIYPNPVRDKLFFETKVSDKIIVNVYNQRGAIVKQQTFSGIGTNHIEISNLPKGIYHLQVYSDESVFNERFIKQ